MTASERAGKRVAAIEKNPERPVVADSTQWSTRRIAAIEKFVVSANVGFLAQGHTHPIGHNPPVGVAIQFHWFGRRAGLANGC